MTVDERFERIEARLDQVESRLTQYILDFRQEATQRLDIVDRRLDMLTAMMRTIDDRMAPFSKMMLDSSTVMGELMRELTVMREQNRKTADAELQARLSKIEQNVAKLMNPAA